MENVLKEVTLETNVYELITTYPDSQEVLIEYGIPCASCHFSSYDRIIDSVEEFGIDEEDVKDLLEQLNEIVRTQKPVLESDRTAVGE
jgi:hemerythrin